jgi:hypothetical protein
MPLSRRTVLLAGTAGLAAAACASDALEAAQAQIAGIERAAWPPGRGPLVDLPQRVDAAGVHAERMALHRTPGNAGLASRVGQAKRTHAVVIEVALTAWVRFA